MTLETIFGVQIFSLVSYIAAAFWLYRVLVSQKDATIQLQKEQIDFLKIQLESAKAEKPDSLVEQLSKRVKASIEEMERLVSDKDKNEELLKEKESEFRNLQNELSDLQGQMEEFRSTAKEYFCPHCQSPLVSREYQTQYYDYHGRDEEIDIEVVNFECGLEVTDGEETQPCGNNKVGNEDALM